MFRHSTHFNSLPYNPLKTPSWSCGGNCYSAHSYGRRRDWHCRKVCPSYLWLPKGYRIKCMLFSDITWNILGTLGSVCQIAKRWVRFSHPVSHRCPSFWSFRMHRASFAHRVICCTFLLTCGVLQVTFHQWTMFLSNFYTPIPNISKYHLRISLALFLSGSSLIVPKCNWLFLRRNFT